MQGRSGAVRTDRRNRTRSWPLGLVPAVAAVLVLAGTLTAPAGARPPRVTDWISHHAAPLATVDPAAPLDWQSREVADVPVAPWPSGSM
jgi:hypothetical protein